MVDVKKLFSVLLVPVICLFFMGIAFAEGNGASVSLDSPVSSQNYKPGDNVQITGKAQNITQVTILVRNAGGGIAYAAQPSVVNGAFSTEFQLNDDAVEGQYTIRIGAKELVEPVIFTFKVSDKSNDSGNNSGSTSHSSGGGSGGGTKLQAVTSTTGRATVTPGAGGTISLGSEATIEIPANALTGTGKMEVKVQKVTTPPAVPAGFKLAGSVYEFSVGGKSSYSFDKNVTIKLSFDPGLISPDETPAIYYYDESQDKWVNLGGTVSGNTVTVQVNHFTKFAVMAVKQEESRPAGTTAVALKDIAGHWAFNNINKLVTMGCISGYPDGTFKPDKPITRAEFASVLVRAFKLSPRSDSIVFADTAGHWAGDCIATAAANGIVSGYDADTFGPDDMITREQMAAMIVKAAKLDPAAGEMQFADSGTISNWAREAMAAATENGIINGYPDGTVRPRAGATRAEAVTVIVNALNKKCVK
jgi:hypothetical protein